jgi:hypothetical protein
MKIRLSSKDIDGFADQSRRYWLETDKSVLLTGETSHLTERQFLALAHIRSAADLLFRQGVISSNPEIQLDFGSSEPDTED